MQGHISFHNRLCIPDLKPAALNFCPLSSDVSGVDGYVEIFKGFVGRVSGEGCGGFPMARRGKRVIWLCEMKDEF
jgi:hypothetical protein